MRPETPFTPGIEVCGEVTAVGDGVPHVSVGDRVIGMAVLPFGGFASHALLDGALCFPAPAQLDAAEAAAFHVSYQTGWFALHRRAQLSAGETVLVHAAAGGVGTAATQIAKSAGATVIGVVGGEEKADVARRAGADLVVDRHKYDFVSVTKEATNGHGADVVFDPVGGETYMRSTKCIAFEGRIVLIGFAGGAIQSAPLNHALVKNYSIVGLHWGLYQTRDPGLVRECHDSLIRLLERAAIRPLIGHRLGFDDIPLGLQALGSGSSTGRIVYVAAD